MDANPYQAPSVTLPPDLPVAQMDPRTVRLAHINHEASVRSIGFLYYLGAVGLFVMAVASVVGLFSPAPTDTSADVATLGAFVGEFIVAIAIPLVIMIVQIIGGRGLRRLTTTGRVIGLMISAIGLLAFPVGTVICGYIIYLLVSKKGSMVFSPKYKAIIAATPDVKYKSSIFFKICLIFLAVIVLICIAAAAFTATVGK